MSPKTKTQYKLIRQEKRALITDTALRVFAEEGYHASSVNRIAERAGISKGLIYNYFTSKEDLLKKIVFDIYNKIIEKYPLNTKETSGKHVEFFIDKTFEFVIEDIDRAKLLFSIYSQTEVMEILNEKVIEKSLPFMNSITKYFQTLKHENPEAMMYYFFSVLDGVQLNLIYNSKFPSESVKEILKNQFIKS